MTSRVYFADPIDDLSYQIAKIRKELSDVANRKQVIVPIWDAATTPTTFPDGVEGQVVIGEDDDTPYVWKGGAWVALSSGSSGGGVNELLFPVSIPGVLNTLTGSMRWYPQNAGTIATWHIALGVAPTGSSFTVRLNKNGSSVTTLSITASSFTASTTSVSTFTVGDYYTLDITAVGSTVPGSDLLSQFIGTLT